MMSNLLIVHNKDVLIKIHDRDLVEKLLGMININLYFLKFAMIGVLKHMPFKYALLSSLRKWKFIK
jgi:hypothetical protein